MPVPSTTRPPRISRSASLTWSPPRWCVQSASDRSWSGGGSDPTDLRGRRVEQDGQDVGAPAAQAADVDVGDGRVEPQPREAVEHLLERHPQLHAGEVDPEAHVRAGAEAQV